MIVSIHSSSLFPVWRCSGKFVSVFIITPTPTLIVYKEESCPSFQCTKTLQSIFFHCFDLVCAEKLCKDFVIHAFVEKTHVYHCHVNCYSIKAQQIVEPLLCVCDMPHMKALKIWYKLVRLKRHKFFRTDL